MLIAAIVSFLMLILDRITKIIATNTIAVSGETVPLIKGVVSLFYTENIGAGFSIFSGKTTFLIIFTIIAMAFVLFLLIKGFYRHPLTNWGFMLVLSGGIGNLIDRIFNGGAVVDFIKTDFMDFPIFNVADICVTIGAGLIILYFVLDLIKETKEKRNSGKDNPDM